MNKFWSSERPVGQTHWTQLSVELGDLTGKCLWAFLTNRQGNGERYGRMEMERDIQGGWVVCAMVESTHMDISGFIGSRCLIFFSVGHLQSS